MKNQARISNKKKREEKNAKSNASQQDNNEYEQQNKSQVKNLKNPQNIEQNVQREKKSSETVSYVEKSSVKSKKRKSKAKTKSKKAISDIKERSEKNTKISSKKEEKKPDSEIEPEQEEELKTDEIVAINNNESPPMFSLKQFVQLYTSGEYDFKKYVKNACKSSIISILKCQSFSDVLKNKKRNDLSSEGHTNTLSESAQERLNKSLNFTILQINQKIESLFTNLSDYISEDHVSNVMQDFYKFISGNNNFVPYTFYSLFELCRINTSDGFIKNVDINQKKMIIGIYMIIKILLN
jgi:hypothetical protein